VDSFVAKIDSKYSAKKAEGTDCLSDSGQADFIDFWTSDLSGFSGR
jgi:hypothetical protein